MAYRTVIKPLKKSVTSLAKKKQLHGSSSKYSYYLKLTKLRLRCFISTILNQKIQCTLFWLNWLIPRKKAKFTSQKTSPAYNVLNPA
jgi:hypothetical protein